MSSASLYPMHSRCVRHFMEPKLVVLNNNLNRILTHGLSGEFSLILEAFTFLSQPHLIMLLFYINRSLSTVRKTLSLAWYLGLPAHSCSGFVCSSRG